MAWFKKDPPPLVPDQVASGDAAALGKVLDTFLAVLRDYGHGAYQLEGLDAGALAAGCEAWAQHLAVGAPRPGAQEKRQALPLERRDWAGVRRFFAAARADEGVAVGRSLGALQQSLWATLRALDGVVAGGGSDEVRTGREMKRLQEAAQSGSVEAIRREVFSVVAQMEQIGRERARRQQQAVEELRGQVKALGEELEIARQEISLDALTRLYNRRAFDERCGQIMAMRRLFGEPSSILIADLDHFKVVNDSFGHAAGDAVLKAVADAITRCFVSRGDFIARYGGEEFAVLLWGAGLSRARTAAEKLVEAVRRQQIQVEGRIIEVTLSIGVAELTQTEDAAGWVARADKALYQAKNEGRNRACIAE